MLARGGQPDPARTAFLAARDLDTMPWRPISLTEQAIRNTALVKGAVLCDVADIFRRESPDGATGWHTIIANVGDQWSDLDGGFAERVFKLPNPVYFIP